MASHSTAWRSFLVILVLWLTLHTLLTKIQDSSSATSKTTAPLSRGSASATALESFAQAGHRIASPPAAATTATATATATTTSKQKGQQSWEKTTNHGMLIIDILSVGSVDLPNMQQAQQDTFGRHPSVRNFYRATERDDVEQDCLPNMPFHQVYFITRYCNDPKVYKRRPFLRWLARRYETLKKVKQKKHPEAWICAQKRPLNAFFNLVNLYQYNSTNLPDYLLVVDDDTWVNLDLVLPLLAQRFPPQQPHAISGCLMTWPNNPQGFAIPCGGYGIFFTRAALWNWIRPLTLCTESFMMQNSTATTTSENELFERLACWRLRQNKLGERYVYQTGMSVLKLLQAYTKARSLVRASETWQPRTLDGFCLHSDTAWGYFTSHYHIGNAGGGPLRTTNDVVMDYKTFKKMIMSNEKGGGGGMDSFNQSLVVSGFHNMTSTCIHSPDTWPGNCLPEGESANQDPDDESSDAEVNINRLSNHTTTTASDPIRKAKRSGSITITTINNNNNNKKPRNMARPDNVDCVPDVTANQRDKLFCTKYDAICHRLTAWHMRHLHRELYPGAAKNDEDDDDDGAEINKEATTATTRTT